MSGKVVVCKIPYHQVVGRQLVLQSPNRELKLLPPEDRHIVSHLVAEPSQRPRHDLLLTLTDRMKNRSRTWYCIGRNSGIDDTLHYDWDAMRIHASETINLTSDRSDVLL